MATCTECGSENPDDSRFCGNCGHALQTAEQSAAEAPTTQDPAATTDQSAPTAPQPPVTTTPPVAPIPTSPPPTTTIPGAPSGPPGGGPNKKALAIVGGVVALIVILAAVWFFFLRDDDAEPRGGVEVSEEAEEGQEGPAEESPDAGAAPGVIEEPAYDAIEPYVAQEAGPYSLTQTSSERCEAPCIFPPEAHSGSVETFQATWDAGSPESAIFGEFLRYESVDDASVGHEIVAAELESIGYEQIDTFTINGVPGTTYQSTDDEILLWTDSNLIMGLQGNKGFPTEFVGYLGP